MDLKNLDPKVWSTKYSVRPTNTIKLKKNKGRSGRAPVYFKDSKLVGVNVACELGVYLESDQGDGSKRGGWRG